MNATCGECGAAVSDWGLHIQTCPHAKTNSHLHIWTLGQIVTEPVGPMGWYTRVAYLLCQCGAVKRTVPQ